MCKIVEIEYLDIPKKEGIEEIIEKVLEKCYDVEKINSKCLYVNIILTNPENIQKMNKQYRNIDKPTDVLSFPMFEKAELIDFKTNVQEVLGDIVISISKVEEQAKEYGHSEKRELAFLTVHGFLHLLGYDHMKPEDEKVMFAHQEEILNNFGITR